MRSLESLREFLNHSGPVVLCEVIEIKGSAPREADAWLLISQRDIFGTIGGGQLEFLSIARARNVLEQVNRSSESLDGNAFPAGAANALASSSTFSIALGPELGQCCGGHVTLSLTIADEAILEQLIQRTQQEDDRQPNVIVFGFGHVGRALCTTLSLLPVQVTAVETRPEILRDLPNGVRGKTTAFPEKLVREAKPATAYVILTHDHALDFMITSEALARKDAAYVGMIGSKTKRATFRSWYQKEFQGAEEDLAQLICPIGGPTSSDKRPAVIAALVAAEICNEVVIPQIAHFRPSHLTRA